jgi:2-hydroxy-3-keto-5-methylthiopentenyl-1-phosphate phosphatase
VSVSNIIAIICDFDDTLGEDTTNLFLKEYFGLAEEEIYDFWNKDVKKLVTKGWDPPLAYIDLILARLKKNKQRIANQDLRDLGSKVRLFPGVLDLFERLRSFVNTRKEFLEAYVQIEFYVITAGFEEIIRGTAIAREMRDIFGCTFDERKGNLVAKSIVTFTEKTKFLYAINKGISGTELRRNPYRVNDVKSRDQRRIPFPNMIYLGDGPTDIPCFSTIQQYGGKTIGVLKYEKKAGKLVVDKWRAWAIAKGERATLGPYLPEYGEGTDLYLNLKLQVERVGLEISDKSKRVG